MTGLGQLLEWTDNRFGLVSLVFCMFNLFLVRGISAKLIKCQNIDMCQVLNTNLAEKIDKQSNTLDSILVELRDIKR